MASIVVFLVALPLCMGIAVASGVPASYGLISGIIGGLVVGSLGGSSLQVSGPAAGLTVIVWEAVERFGIETIGAIIVVAGLVQLIAGVAKLGQWFRAVSPAVIHGMLAGIGVLIFSSQFHIMLDDEPQGKGIVNLITIPQALYSLVSAETTQVHHMAGLVGLVTIVSLVLWNKFKPKALRSVPAQLVGVLLGSLLARRLGLPISFVDVPDGLLSSLRVGVSLDAFVQAMSRTDVLFTGLALAFIASAETLLAAAAVDKMHRGPRANYDRELAAQGVGNLLCGVFGGLPMTGVIVRSTANVEAGAKTRLSAILHGLWLLLFVTSLPWLLRMIPTAALAAVLVFSGYKLVNFAAIRDLRRFGRWQVAIYFITLAGIVVVDLLTGVALGVVVALFKVLHDRSKLVVTVEDWDGLTVMRLAGSATFFRVPQLALELEKIPFDRNLVVKIDGLEYIDDACFDLLNARRKAGGRIDAPWEELLKRCNRVPHLDAPPRKSA